MQPPLTEEELIEVSSLKCAQDPMSDAVEAFFGFVGRFEGEVAAEDFVRATFGPVIDAVYRSFLP